jgi:mono/diheme cytochrome c family protein
MHQIRPILLAIVLTVFALVPIATRAADTKGNEMAGAVLFRDKGCVHCHGVGGIGTQKGPSLVGLRKSKLWTAAKMTDQILNGGQKMPPFADSVTDPEVAQIVAYLRAKQRPVPSPAQ